MTSKLSTSYTITFSANLYIITWAQTYSPINIAKDSLVINQHSTDTYYFEIGSDSSLTTLDWRKETGLSAVSRANLVTLIQALVSGATESATNLTLTDTTNQITTGAAAHTTVSSFPAPSGASCTLTFPNATTTLVGTDTADTLTNKVSITTTNETISSFGTGIVHSNGSGLLSSSTIVNADINAAAAIVDTKLATISTASKVSNSATTATSANTASAIVARDGSGNFTTSSIDLTTSLQTDTITAHTVAATISFSSQNYNNGVFLVGTSGQGGCAFADTVNKNRYLRFNLDGASATKILTLLSSHTTDITITLPNATDTLVGKATIDTLTNKTLTFPVIATISNSGTITIPTGTDTLVGKATVDTLTNKTLTTPVISSISNSGTITIPTGTDTLVGKATSDILTNKTLTDFIDTATCRCTSQTIWNLNTTLSAITGMSVDVTASGFYAIIGSLSTSSGLSGGLQIALVGTASMTATSCYYYANFFASGAANVTTSGTGTFGTGVGATAAIVNVLFSGTVQVNAGGTLRLYGAQNASNGTNSIVQPLSWMTVRRIS
jgi:hypothetical protein